MVEEIAKKATTRIGFTVVMLAVLLVLGTVGFHSIETYQSGLLEGENWTYVDSFYFSAMTITTIGYGDLYPSHDLSKVITVFYAFLALHWSCTYWGLWLGGILKEAHNLKNMR